MFTTLAPISFWTWLLRSWWLLLLSSSLYAAEFRGAWVATVYNLDWPSKPGSRRRQQKAELRAILDRAAELKLNAILFQVRPACDALYTSKQRAVVGVSHRPAGRAAGLRSAGVCDRRSACAGDRTPRMVQSFSCCDPRGRRRSRRAMWRACIPSGCGGMAASSGSIQASRRRGDHVIDVMLDVVRRYDIDGVHIDDYFYPYPKGGRGFPDSATWAPARRTA